MADIKEHLKIFRQGNNIVSEEVGTITELPADTKVSMNFFCLSSSYIEMCEEEFNTFLDKNMQNPKAEFFVTHHGRQFHQTGRAL